MELLKYKLLSFEELVINLDRLSRFKLPEDSYNKVFSNIIFKYLIYPKYSKTQIDNLDSKIISNIVKTIWNESVKKILNKDIPSNIQKKNLLKFLVNSSFKNINRDTKILVNTNLNILPILNKLSYEKISINLKFLKYLSEKDINADTLRLKYALKFPIKKLLIVEGITEEILLPVFAKKLNHDFNKEGIFILGAGGKSKSPSLYLQYKNKLKIPIILMFDSDAKEIFNLLKRNLLKKDSVIILDNGEFEDIISAKLIKRALNKEYLPATPITLSELKQHKKMCENIKECYKTRKIGEFKKAKFSQIIAKNVKYKSDITTEIENIVYNII